MQETQIPEGLELSARSLIQRAANEYDETYGFGSMSSAVYDTAWVSLVAKDTADGRQWVFPECLRYIVDEQLDDGSWGPSISQVDGVLNTAASILALQAHRKEPLQIQNYSAEFIDQRITRATESLARQLSSWDVLTCAHVGFEIIVPALLDLLAADGLTYVYPGESDLKKLNAIKLKGFKPEMLYTRQSSALHSLEAFVGKIDFGKISHHKVNGAIMASPSATAAYLIHNPKWDEEAEAYLNFVVKRNGRAGGVPSAFPSTCFEFTWLLSTFLKSGFAASDLDCPELEKLIEVIAGTIQGENGVIGFAPGLTADADDTAKGLISLSMLGRRHPGSSSISNEAMVAKFETEKCFRTYSAERDPSFSVNCNVLLALANDDEPSRYIPQISKIICFLTSRWWDSDDYIKDKWNLSHLYSTMLLVQALGDFIRLLERNNTVSNAFDEEMKSRISVTFFQACSRTLHEQQDNGSWYNSIEQTAYGTLILSEARQHIWFQGGELEKHMAASIDYAVEFLSRAGTSGESMDLIWIEKVTYGSSFLTEIYRLAALKSATISASSEKPATEAGEKDTKMLSYVGLFRKTPLFAEIPKWQVHASYVEATLFRPMLRSRRLSTFPRTDMAEDKYFDIIPFTWTACNNRLNTFASTSFIFEMMIISFLNYQADEFMESVAGPLFQENTRELRTIVDEVVMPTQNVAKQTHDEAVDMDISQDMDNSPGSPATEVKTHLEGFRNQVLLHPLISNASEWDRQVLVAELRVFLQAHITQHEDNRIFRLQSSREQIHEPAGSFYHWVHTTSADHTSCPYSFAFVRCLISASLRNGEMCFPTAMQDYSANCLCRHLSTMCRIYNDYGSIRRDAAEGNLNSVNFPELGFSGSDAATQKQGLYKMAQLERTLLEESFKFLEADVEAHIADQNVSGGAERRKLAIFRMFIEVTDLYGQIYVIKDIASSMKAGAAGVQ